MERLNMKYTLMLRNIEKRLAERRRKLEINKEQIEQINKILNLEPECEEPPLTEQLPQKQEPIAKPPTFSNLLRKASKPKISQVSNQISLKEKTVKTDAGHQAKVMSRLDASPIKSNQDPFNLENPETVEENMVYTKKNLIEDTILDVGKSTRRKNEEVSKPLNEVKKKNVNYLNKPKARDNLYKLDVPDNLNISRNLQYNYLGAPEFHKTELKNVDIEESKLFAKKMLIYDTILEVGKSDYSATSLGNNFTTLKELQSSEVVAAPKIPLINEIVVQKNHTELLNSFKSAKAVEVPHPDILDGVMKEMSRTTVDQPKIVVQATQRNLNTTQTSNYSLKVGEPSKAEWKSVKVEENQVFAKKSLIDDTIFATRSAEKSLENKSKTLKKSQKVDEVGTPKTTSASEVLVQKKQEKLLDDMKVFTKKEVLSESAKSVKGADIKVPKLTLPVEISQRPRKKYELEKDEQFMSVEKTKVKASQGKCVCFKHFICCCI